MVQGENSEETARDSNMSKHDLGNGKQKGSLHQLGSPTQI
jgi:hypothetical protein